MTETETEPEQSLDDFVCLLGQRVEGSLYRLENGIGQFYLGSTLHWNLAHRLALHHEDYVKASVGIERRMTSSQLWNHPPVNITLIRKEMFANRQEMYRAEAALIREHKDDPNLVNKNIPYSTPEEKAAARRERENRLVPCEVCGCEVKSGYLSRHKKTKKCSMVASVH